MTPVCAVKVTLCELWNGKFQYNLRGGGRFPIFKLSYANNNVHYIVFEMCCPFVDRCKEQYSIDRWNIELFSFIKKDTIVQCQTYLGKYKQPTFSSAAVAGKAEI